VSAGLSAGPVLRSQLSGAARRPGRLLLTGLAVLVGSFVAFGTVLAHEIMARTTLANFSTTAAAADLVVSAPDGGDNGGPDGIGAGALAGIRRLPMVAAATGRIEDRMLIRDDDDLTVTADPGDGPLARIRLVAGRYPQAPGELAIDRTTAKRLRLSTGAHLAVRRQGDPHTKPVDVTVTAVVAGPKTATNRGYAPDRVITALLVQPKVPRVDVALTPGTDRAAAAAALRPYVRTAEVTDAAVVRVGEAKDAVRQFDDLFAVIGMFVAIAMVAAVLVATSSFRIVFAQRMRQLALLRTVGAQRGQLVRVLAVEGAVTGLVAGTVGVLLAQAVALLVPELAGGLASPGVPLTPGLLVVAGATVVTLGAVLAPAWSAAQVAPLQALRSSGVNAAQRGIGTARLVGGLVLAVAAVVCAGVAFLSLPGPNSAHYTPYANLYTVVASGALTFGALITLGPVLVRPVLWAVGWPLRRLGPTGTLAVGGVGGAPRRAAAVSAVVALGVTLVSGTLVGMACVRAYVDRGLAVHEPTDFQVMADDGPVAPGVVRGLAGSAALRDATAYRVVAVAVGGGQDSATDLDLDRVPRLRNLEARTGSVRGLRPGHVVVAGPLADAEGIRAGDRIEVKGKRGTLRLTVDATLPGAGPIGQGLVVAPADVDALGGGTGAAGVLVDAAQPGEAGQAAARTAIDRIAKDHKRIEVMPLWEVRQDMADDIDLVFRVALGLLALTVIIAVVGVGTTTALSVLERTRESGLLRALGLTRSGLRGMLGLESALYGALGAVIGLALGVPYAWLAVAALNLNAPMRLPVGQLLLLFGIIAAVTAAAGVLPARRAARVTPVAALATVE
jgi:putative ABC transport system permease protein